MSPSHYLLFLFLVALATYAQTMTGFAFGLVLLGLAGLFELAPLPVMSNVVSILALINAAVTIGRTRPSVDWQMLRPALLSSFIGVGVGVMALQWMTHDFAVVLHVLLGLTIVVCAFMLIGNSRRRSQASGRTSFVMVGALSGLLGGLFSSGGPPMVYHLYRQPLPLATVRNTLLMFFALMAAARLTLVTVTGAIDMATVIMSLSALPVVIILTWLIRRYANMDAVVLIRWLVFLLLLCAGLGLLVPAGIEMVGMVV